MKRLSIIIATYNRLEALQECMAAMPWPMLHREKVELLVVVDGSDDGTASWLTETYPDVRRLVFPENHGLAYARNTGARAAHADYFWFLDDDVALESGWLEAVLANLQHRTLLGGRILDWDGQREQGGPARSTFIGKRIACAPEKANAGTGCNLGIPKPCFEALGGFDERLHGYGFEDSDFCIRAKRADYAFRYLPEATVRHRGQERKTGDQIRSQERNSTYAMLMIYTGNPGKRMLFTLLNGLWMGYRYGCWRLSGRREDAARLYTGWREGYRDYRNRT